MDHLQLNSSMYLSHVFEDKCRIQLQNQIWYLRFCKKGSEKIKRRKGSCFTAEIGTCFSFDLSRNFGKNVEERERERAVNTLCPTALYCTFFFWKCCCRLKFYEGMAWLMYNCIQWTTFCSNNYCTQLSLVLIAHNQSVQDSETWKCTVPVFAPISIVQFKYTQGKYLT